MVAPAKGRTSCRNSKITPANLARNALTWHGHGCHFEKYGYSENDIQELVSKGLAKVEDKRVASVGLPD